MKKQLFIFALLLLTSPPARAASNSGTEVFLQNTLGGLGMNNSYMSMQLQQHDLERPQVTKGTTTIVNGMLGLYFSGDHAQVTQLIAAVDSFVTLAGNNSTFEVTYINPYVTPNTDYPRVIIKTETDTEEEFTMSLSASVGDEYTYRYIGLISTGVYQYKYIVTNAEYPAGYEIAWSSFVVTLAPQEVTNIGLEGDSFTSSSRVLLQWSATATTPGGLSYKLYFRAADGSYSVIYDGPMTEYEIFNLPNGTKYYWYIEATNVYNESTTSEVYSFETIAAPETTKAFNYPNPFNPRTGPTAIVFNVATAQTVKISIYSEYGDLIFTEQFNALPGTNEFLYYGRDGRSRELFDGTYICRIETTEGAKTCYLLLLK